MARGREREREIASEEPACDPGADVRHRGGPGRERVQEDFVFGGVGGRGGCEGWGTGSVMGGRACGGMGGGGLLRGEAGRWGGIVSLGRGGEGVVDAGRGEAVDEEVDESFFHVVGFVVVCGRRGRGEMHARCMG